MCREALNDQQQGVIRVRRGQARQLRQSRALLAVPRSAHGLLAPLTLLGPEHGLRLRVGHAFIVASPLTRKR
jgi:hypothetical protein